MLEQIIGFQAASNSDAYSRAWLETLCLTALSAETMTEIVGYEVECPSIPNSEDF